MMKKVSLLWLIVLVLGATVGTQSAGLRARLLEKAKEIYGPKAPSTVTFVKVSREDLGEFGPNSKEPQPQLTVPGDSATGTVVDEKGNQVYVDSSPCQLHVMTFTQPYTKSAAGTATCDGKQKPTFKFVQK